MARGKGEGGLNFDKTNQVWVGSVELQSTWDEESGKWKRRRRTASSKNKKIAAQKLLELQKDAQKGILTLRTATVEEWITQWLDEVAPERYAPKTMRSYRSALNTHIIPRWGDRKLAQITPGQIRTRIQEVAKDKSPGMARNVHIPLSACLRDAVNDGYLEAHPMANLSAPKRSKKTENALEVEQAVNLLKWLARQMDEKTKWAGVAPLFITYLLTGARRAEILGLRPEYTGESLDVEWQLQRITPAEIEAVSASYEHEHVGISNFYLVRPKYESTRSYPLVEPLKSVIEAVVIDTPPGALIFRTEEGKPWDPDDITEKWAEVLNAAGIEKHDGPEKGRTPKADRVTLHGTRHTVVDLLYMLEVPEHIISDIVGHTQRRTTRGYRTRQSPAVRSAMESVSRLLQTGEVPKSPQSAPSPAELEHS